MACFSCTSPMLLWHEFRATLNAPPSFMFDILLYTYIFSAKERRRAPLNVLVTVRKRETLETSEKEIVNESLPLTRVTSKIHLHIQLFVFSFPHFISFIAIAFLVISHEMTAKLHEHSLI